MHTVNVLSGVFGATYETLPGRLRLVNDLEKIVSDTARIPAWSPAGFRASYTLDPRCRAWGVFERRTAEHR